jgi:hypothetical protein
MDWEKARKATIQPILAIFGGSIVSNILKRCQVISFFPGFEDFIPFLLGGNRSPSMIHKD